MGFGYTALGLRCKVLLLWVQELGAGYKVWGLGCGVT